jgi:predicted nucleotidyltransferase
MVEEIRQARRRSGLTQARLARRARTSQAAISDYESGKRAPEPETLARILRATRPLPSEVLDASRSEVLDAAARFGVTDIAVFGSVARGDDGPDSDVDLLVTLPVAMTAVRFVELCEELEAILSAAVDLVDATEVPADDPIRAEALVL